MPEHNDDLLKSAYRMAGCLAISESLHGGGWFLVWHDEKSGRYPATGLFQHALDDKPLVTLAGLIAEQIGTTETGADEPADLDACLTEAQTEMERKTGETLSKSEARHALKLVCSRWFQVRGYALTALIHWQQPDSLPRFLLANLKHNEAILDHQKAAYEPGVETPASLVQGADARFHIPPTVRVKGVQ